MLGFSAREVARVARHDDRVGEQRTAARARRWSRSTIPEQSQQATLRSLGDERLGEIVERYSEALEQGDVDALLDMLTEDATWSMPPLPNWYRGHEAITGFLHKGPFTVRWRHVPTRANGQLAVGCYMWDEEKRSYRAFALDVLTLRGAQIAEVTAFLDRSIFARFGLPDELPA